MTDYLHALPPGYRIQEYELVRVLGSGGFGITYLGYDHNLDKAVAIKEYLPNDLAVRADNNSVLPKSTQDKADYEWGLERFLNEAQTLARFDHRHIIKIHRFFRVHGTGYIVMEYAEGETLSALLQRKGTLTEAELKQILFPILDGLEAVHRADFLHRDIKPGNIVIRDDGSPVLIDFGSARQAVVSKSRSVTAIVTPGYAPIEQYSTKGHQGPWTDIYGLGAVCYRCLTGAQPDDATQRLRKDPLVPAAQRCEGKASASLLRAIDEALRVDEGERPKSIKVWRSELDRADDADTGCPLKDDDITIAKIHNKGEDIGGNTSAEISPDEEREKYLASRSIRLGAWLVDVFIVIISSMPVFMLVYIAAGILGFAILSPSEEFALGTITVFSTYALLNGYFLVKRGQTLGKMLLRIRIVDAESKEIVSFWRVFVLRWLVWILIALVPILSVVTLLDPFFIFKKQRRCLHDYLARTIVVNNASSKIASTASDKSKSTLPHISAFVWILGVLVVIVTTIAIFNGGIFTDISNRIRPDDIFADISWEDNPSEDNLSRPNVAAEPRAETTTQAPKEPLYVDLGKTSGFIIGQRLSLNHIANEYPALSPRAIKAEREFNLTFGVAEKNIEKSLRNILKDGYPEYIATIEEEIKSISKPQQINRDIAAQFLDEVELRAKGKIPSPMLETLLHYQFKARPAEELIRGFKTIYRTKGHPKTKGLDVQIEYAKSWSLREGKRPNIIQFFRSNNARGPAFASILIKDIVDEAQGKLTRRDIQILNTLEGSRELASEMFSEKNLSEMAKDMGMLNVRNISTKRMVLDNWPGAMLEFTGDQRRLDITMTMYNRMYMVIYKNYTIFLQCQVLKLPDETEKTLKTKTTRFMPLFDLMANSLVIQSQY